MKKIAFGAFALLFPLIALAGEPMATMKYVTNQVNRLDGRIDAVPTYSDVTNIAKTAATPEGYDIVSNKAVTAVQPGDMISVLTNDLNFVDETITNGLITATNAMTYADQVGEETLEKAKEEMERQGLVNTNDLKLALDGYRAKSDVKAYVSGPVFDLSKIDADYKSVAPFVCYPAKVSESPARYVWLLVDKNGNARKSSEVYNTQTALMSAKTARFSYGANTYTVTATDRPADYSFIYTGDGSGITDFKKTTFGNLATEPFVSAKAEEIIESKGFATEDFVTGNYYDKTTVDTKISGATPGNYETVSNNAINALMRTNDTFKGILTVASPGVSGRPFGISVSKGGTIKLDGQDVVYGVNVNGAGYSGGNIDLSIPTSASDLEAYNKEEVDTKVAGLQAQIEAMTAFEMKEVDELPERGEPGIIYLVPDPESPGDKINWLWIVDPATGDGKWVRVGSTKVNLKDYARKATTLEGYGIEDAYTKTQADRKAGEIAAATNKYVANIRATADIGVHKVDAKTGYVDLYVRGLSMQQALEYLVSQRLDPGDPTYPSITTVNLTGAGEKEVGDTFTPTYSITVSTGKYDYGPDPTGSTFDQFLVTDSLGGSKTTQSGSFDSFPVLDSTDYRVSAKAHYTQGAKPKDNKGNTVEDSSKRIQAYWWNKKTTSSLADTAKSAAVTGYRKWYTYAGTSAEAIDSTFIRTKCTDRGNGKTAASIAEMVVPDNSTRVMIALPKVNGGYGYKKTVISVIDIDGMGLDIIEKFVVSEVSVNAKTPAAPAMTYTVWMFSNPRGIPKTRLNVVIADAPMLLASVKRGVNAPRAGDAPTYQPAANLNVALARQFEGPLDVSAVFYKEEDLDYYVTKGRESEGISPYWIGKTPYPYAGQIVALVLPGCSPTNYLLKANADSGFDKVQLAIGGDLDDYAKKATTLEGYGIEDAYNKTETESLAQSAEDNAKAYTDDQISKIEPASFIQIPTARFTNEIVSCGLYHMSGEPAGDSYMTNVVINPDNGYPVMGSVVLNGIFAGHEFHNEKFDMLGGEGDTMSGSVGIDTVTYTMSFKCPLNPTDPITDEKWGLMKVVRSGLEETTDRYMHYDYREFRDVEKIVDTTPNVNHTNSLITSKAVAEVAESVGGKLSKSGDTAGGDFIFDNYSEFDGWTLPSFGWSNAKSYQVGTASKDGESYEGGIGVGVGELLKSNVKFPISFRIRKQVENEIREVNYTEDGVSEGSMTTMPPVPAEYRTVSFQRDEYGNLKAGAFALTNDVVELAEAVGSSTNDIKESVRAVSDRVKSVEDDGAKTKTVLSWKKTSGGSDIATFDGSEKRSMVSGNGIKFESASDKVSVSVDTNVVATLDYVDNSKPEWVYNETNGLRMTANGDLERKTPWYTIGPNGGTMKKVFKPEDLQSVYWYDNAELYMLYYSNGKEALIYQRDEETYHGVFRYFPNIGQASVYYYMTTDEPISDETFILNEYNGSRVYIMQLGGFEGEYEPAGNIAWGGPDYSEFFAETERLDGRIDETHAEILDVSNAVLNVKRDRIYDINDKGLFAKYLLEQKVNGTDYSFVFEMKPSDIGGTATTYARYSGRIVEQRKGPKTDDAKLYLRVYTNSTYYGQSDFLGTIGESEALATEKFEFAMGDPLFPLNVGDSKSGTNVKVTKLAQDTQEIVSYVKGNLDIRKVADDSLIDRVARTSEVVKVTGELRTSIGEVSTAVGELATRVGTVETMVGNKADKSTTYTKNEVDTALGEKADKATTLDGYSIGDAYTKEEADFEIATAKSAAIMTAKAYTDEAIKGGGGGSGTNSVFKIATGEYAQSIDRIALFEGSTEGSAIIEGCWLTNVVLNTANGYPQSATIHLNGTYCGRTFDNEEYNLTAEAGDSSARFVIDDEKGKYTLYYRSYTPSDPLNTKYRGYFVVNRSSPYDTKSMYSFTEHRVLGPLDEEVDATPMSSHSKSLITSKAVYDATNGKLNKTGGTMTGNLEFSGTTTVGVWTLPLRSVYGGRYLANGNISGTVSGKKTTYGAGIFAGEGELLNPYDVRYPQALRFFKEEIVGGNSDIDYTRYTIDGIEQETAKVYNGNVTTNGASLKIPKDATTGVMLGGTIARVEDIAPVQRSVEDMVGDVSEAKSKAETAHNEIVSLQETGLKSPNALSLQNASGISVSSYDGGTARTVKFGNGLTATQSSATTTVEVDDTKYPSKTTVASDIAAVKAEMKKTIDGKVVDRIYENISRPDAITAVYVISNSSTRKEYPIAFCTTNWSGTATSATFEAIDNPTIDPSSTLRGWSKASMSTTVSGTYTNWYVYVYVSANKPSSYGSCYAQFVNDKYPIFPGEIGETRASYSGGYYLRKIAQFNGAVGKYIAGDGNIYSVSGSKIDSLVKTSDLDGAIENKVSPVRSTAETANITANNANNKANSAYNLADDAYDIANLLNQNGAKTKTAITIPTTDSSGKTIDFSFDGTTALKITAGEAIEMKGAKGTPNIVELSSYPTGLWDDGRKRKMDGGGNIKFKMPKYSYNNGTYPFTRTSYTVKDGELTSWIGKNSQGMILTYTNHMMYCNYYATTWSGKCEDPLFEGHIALTTGTIYNMGFEDGWYDAGSRFVTPASSYEMKTNLEWKISEAINYTVSVSNRIDNIKIDRIYDKYDEDHAARYEFYEGPTSEGAHSSDEYRRWIMEFESTNFTMNASGVRKYTAKQIQQTSGASGTGHLYFEYDTVNKKGRFSGWCGGVISETPYREYLTPTTLFTTNNEWRIWFDSETSQLTRSATKKSSQDISFTQYIKGDLNVYDNNDAVIATLETVADVDGKINAVSEYTTAVSNRMESMVRADPLCFADGNLVSRHLFAKSPYAFYWAANSSYYSHMKWRKIVFRNESDLTDYYIDFSPVAYGNNYKGVLRYYNKYSASNPKPAMMFQVRNYADSVPDDEVTFNMTGDGSVRIAYFNSQEDFMKLKSFTLSTQIGGGSGYGSYTIQCLYDKDTIADFGTADRAVRYSEIFGTGLEKVEITNGSIPFHHEAVNFTYDSGTFGVNTTDWPNYKSMFIFGTVAEGVDFASNIRFSGFVNSNGTIVPASATTIPRGSKWYGNIRRINSNYYIEYIGVCE